MSLSYLTTYTFNRVKVMAIKMDVDANATAEPTTQTSFGSTESGESAPKRSRKEAESTGKYEVTLGPFCTPQIQNDTLKSFYGFHARFVNLGILMFINPALNDVIENVKQSEFEETFVDTAFVKTTIADFSQVFAFSKAYNQARQQAEQNKKAEEIALKTEQETASSS